MGGFLGLSTPNVENYPETISEDEYNNLVNSIFYPNLKYMYKDNLDYGMGHEYTTYSRLSQPEFDNIILKNFKKNNLKLFC